MLFSRGVVTDGDELQDQQLNVCDAQHFDDDRQRSPIQTAHEVPGGDGGARLRGGRWWIERVVKLFEPLR
jgi:hypothetical protein